MNPDLGVLGEKKHLLDKVSDSYPTVEAVTEDTGEVTTTQPPHSFSRNVFGYSCTLIAVVGCVLGTCCAQALGDLVPPFELNMWRYLAQLIVATPVAIYKWRIIIPQKKHIPWFIVLCISSMAYSICYYTASSKLPLGTLGGMTPSLILIFMAVLTLVFLRNFSVSTGISVGLCIIGIMLITQPAFFKIFPENNVTPVYRPPCGSNGSIPANNTNDNSTANDATFQLLLEQETLHKNKKKSEWKQVEGYVLILFGGFIAATANFVTNQKLHDMDSFVAVFWVGTIGVIFSAIPMLIFEWGKMAFPTALPCRLLILGHAVGACCGAMCSLFGAQTVYPVIFGILQTSQVALLFVCQYTVMHHIRPGKDNHSAIAIEIVGAFVVVFGNIIGPVVTFWQQRRASRRQEDRQT